MSDLIKRETLTIKGALIKVRTVSAFAFSHVDVFTTGSKSLILLLGEEKKGEKGVFRVDDFTLESIRIFALLLLTSESVAKDLLGFEWPDYKTAPVEDLVKAFKVLERMHSNDLKRWYEACERVNLPPGDPSTGPEPPTSPKN